MQRSSPLNEGLHWGSSFTVLALVRSLSIVDDKKRIQIRLDFFNRGIHLLSEEDRIELIKKRLVKPFGYPVRLRISGLGLRMLNIIEIQKQLIGMILSNPAVFCPL